MVLRTTDTGILAARILAVLKTLKQIAPVSAAEPGFDLADAYRVSADIVERRVKRGEVPVGWKIGFTNRTIWDEYGVHAPIWGPVYDTTAAPADPTITIACPVGRLVEPRIEPEIVFRIATPPEPGAKGAALLACLDGVGHGFEIVQSVYPEWKFTAADTVAAFALHGRLFYGPFTEFTDANRAEWLARLGDFEMLLYCDGVFVDRGKGTNVLDGPLSALAHFVSGLDAVSGGRLKPGDIVTTGTVTRAFPVKAGETWRSELAGLPLPGLTIRFD